MFVCVRARREVRMMMRARADEIEGEGKDQCDRINWVCVGKREW